MWDNTATLHCAGRVGAAVDDASRRLLYRYVLDGLSPLAARGASPRPTPAPAAGGPAPT